MTAEPQSQPHGEASLGEHTIVMDFRRWRLLERLTGKRMAVHLQAMSDGLGYDEVFSWLNVFLTEPLSEDELDALIMRGGAMAGYEAALVALSKAADGFFSPPKEVKAKNPPKAE